MDLSKVKESFIEILSPLLLAFLARELHSMKPLFLAENDELKKNLYKKDFHNALSTHPSILFGERRQGGEKASFLKIRIAYLKKCIKIGLLKNERGHKLMYELGMQSYFGNGVEFWFEEWHFPIKPYHLPEVEKPQGKLAVYSALTGNYDNVHEILYKEDGVDYLLFTNNPYLKSKTWQVILVESELDNKLLSREIKMFPHKYLGDAYDMSIYIDANAVIYGEISNLTKYLKEEKTFAVSRHGERNSVKEEIDIIVTKGLVAKEDAFSQYERYLNDGFCDDMGLAECSILVRKHRNDDLIKLMECWWKEFVNGARRDQIALLPCIQKSKFKQYVFMDGYVRHNQFCKLVDHRKVFDK